MADSSEQFDDSPPPPFDGLASIRADFPKTQADMDNDPRVSWSKSENKYILEDDDGAEWEYDFPNHAWVPSTDQALVRQQQEAYKVDKVNEHEAAAPTQKRKRDGTDINSSKKPRKPQQERKPTAVYVTSLPLDVTEAQVIDVFSRYGVISEKIDSGEPNVKLYTDENGKPKGDALVVYFRPESVPLAIQMLDESDFHPGQPGPTGPMSVIEADPSYKHQKAPQPDDDKDETKQDDKSKEAQRRTKEMIIKRSNKLNAKLGNWSDDDDEPAAMTHKFSRFDKTVILKHMFTLEELRDDPAALLDIKEEIRDECDGIGHVLNVVLFDKEEDGYVSVRFEDATAARTCVRTMNGRSFDGRVVEARIADGEEKFRKTTKESEDAETQEARIRHFERHLEGGGGSKEAKRDGRRDESDE